MKGKKLVLSLLCVVVLLIGVVGCAAPDPILDIYTQDVLPGTNDDYKVGEQTNPYYEGWFENLYFNDGVVDGDLTVNGNVSAYYYFGTGTFDAKGDILVGTGDNAYDNLPVGSDGQVLMANSSASTGVNWTTITVFMPGMMMMYGAAAAPDGWLLCDGTAISRTTYADLYAVLGTTYGSGDGSTTFNLPDIVNYIIKY